MESIRTSVRIALQAIWTAVHIATSIYRHRRFIPLSQLCGSSRGSLVLQPWPSARSTHAHGKITRSIFLQEFRGKLWNVRKPWRNRIDRKQNVNLPRGPQPSARQPQPSADQNISFWSWIGYCPNCALLSNHFLTHNLLRLADSVFSSSKFSFFLPVCSYSDHSSPCRY